MAQKKIKVIVEDEFEAKKQEILKKLNEAKKDADDVAYKSERCHHTGCGISAILEDVIEEIKGL
jgi:hypothetical protein